MKDGIGNLTDAHREDGFQGVITLAERLAYAEGWSDGRRDRGMRHIVTYALFLLAGFGFGIAFQIATKGPC